jgi:hypothetical protein
VITERMDMGHHIVPEPTLVSRGNLEVGVVQVCAHLRHGLVRDVEP